MLNIHIISKWIIKSKLMWYGMSLFKINVLGIRVIVCINNGIMLPKKIATYYIKPTETITILSKHIIYYHIIRNIGQPPPVPWTKTRQFTSQRTKTFHMATHTHRTFPPSTKKSANRWSLIKNRKWIIERTCKT